MADKVPIRAVFNDAGTATGLSEFQSGDTIGLTHGGLGASLSLGTAGQVLKVNSSANALEFGVVEAIVNIDNASDLTSNTLVASDLLLLSDGGTEGRVTLSQVDTLFSGTSKTLTNKTFDLDANTLTGTLSEFNSALQSDSFVGLAATQTLTNKTLTSPTINSGSLSAPTLTGVVTATGAVFAGGSPLVFEGATDNGFETTFAITDPTADRTVTFQDASGTVAYLTDITGGGASEFSTVTVNTSVIFEGSTDDANETTLVASDPDADRTITLPNATGTVVLQDTTDTLTNKTITDASITGSTGTINLTSSGNKIRFNFAGTGAFPSSTDYEGMFAYDTTGNKPYVLDTAGAVNLLTENDSVSRHADVNISGIADGNGLIWSSAQGRFNAGALPSTGFSIAMAVAL